MYPFIRLRRVHYLLFLLIATPLVLLGVAKQYAPRSELMFISGQSISISGVESRDFLCKRIDRYFTSIGFKPTKPEYYRGRVTNSPYFVVHVYPRHVYEGQFFELVIEQLWQVAQHDTHQVQKYIDEFERQLNDELPTIADENPNWTHRRTEGRLFGLFLSLPE